MSRCNLSARDRFKLAYRAIRALENDRGPEEVQAACIATSPERFQTKDDRYLRSAQRRAVDKTGRVRQLLWERADRTGFKFGRFFDVHQSVYKVEHLRPLFAFHRACALCGATLGSAAVPGRAAEVSVLCTADGRWLAAKLGWREPVVWAIPGQPRIDRPSWWMDDAAHPSFQCEVNEITPELVARACGATRFPSAPLSDTPSDTSVSATGRCRTPPKPATAESREEI